MELFTYLFIAFAALCLIAGVWSLVEKSRYKKKITGLRADDIITEGQYLNVQGHTRTSEETLRKYQARNEMVKQMKISADKEFSDPVFDNLKKDFDIILSDEFADPNDIISTYTSLLNIKIRLGGLKFISGFIF
ncbi:MAG: hypothetical protein H7Y00_14880 [Fimbriimonadaceae bacterium]|nr:hypothetical protein [Chitinophagales bacterium]